uniref:Uncharacterized protein n=1 Tax=Pararge aegeria TaxID=116150 RepID=S4NTT4_9NEOP
MLGTAFVSHSRDGFKAYSPRCSDAAWWAILRSDAIKSRYVAYLTIDIYFINYYCQWLNRYCNILVEL